VGDRLGVAPTPVDFGIDLATQTTFTGQVTVQLTNLRTDAPQTYTAAASCCSTTGQTGGALVTATVDKPSVTVSAGGTATLVVSVTATNAPLLNGRWLGSLALSSPLGALTVPLTFFKGYGLQVNAPVRPAFLAVSSAQAGSQTLAPPTGPSTTFLSTTPGPFYVEGAWASGVTWKHSLAVVNSDVALPSVLLDPSQAIYTINIQPRDETGHPFANALNLTYRFTHSASGGGVQRGIGVGGTINSLIWVSAIPAGINFTAAGVTASPDPVAYVYELPGPITGSQTLTNAGSDVFVKEVRLFQPGAGPHPAYFTPTACLTWFPYVTDPPGPIGDIRVSCYSGPGALWPSGVGRILFYNSSNRDLLAAPYPDAPSVSYDLRDGSSSGNLLGHGPQMWPSLTHPLTYMMPSPWYGSMRPSEVYAGHKCDEPPGNVLPVGAGPLQDEWAWRNHKGDAGFLAGRGAFENPFIWGGCTTDSDYTTAPVSYRLYRAGVLVNSATMAINLPLSLSLPDGPYRYEMTRAPTVAGQVVTSETVTTFETSATMSLDENPPALRGLHLVGRGLWQSLLDPAIASRIRFNVDPVPGNGDSNPQGPPPLYTPLADGLVQVELQQSTDGVTWRDVPVSSLGGGDYQTDVLDVDPSAIVTSFRITATDLGANTLRYTFQIPRGASYGPAGGDTTPPTTSITSPAGGATLAGAAPVAAVAADDVGVARVDLLVDGVRAGTSAAPPYAFTLDTSTYPPGPHVLQTRALDAAENVGLSAPVSVTLQNSDTTPPVVSFTTPDAGQVVAGNILVTASASDDARVARVEIYDGATLLGAPTTPPYTVAWATAGGPGGVHTLRAVAYDAEGNSAAATRNVTVDASAPVVTWTAPANGATIGGTVALTASATDDTGVTRVEFVYEDYSVLGTVTSPPYTFNWDTTAYKGVHHLRARAYDAVGNMGQSALVTVTLSGDVTPPTVAITTPVEGAILGLYNNVLITASDPSGITNIEFDDGATVLFSGNLSPPYGLSYTTTNIPDGAHTLVARATDGSGNVGVSAPVHVTVDKVPPLTAVTAPLLNAHVSGQVLVQATASDAVALATVGIEIDGIAIATLSTGPFVATWDTFGWSDGWHSVTSRATDKASNQTVSSVYVVVDNSVTPTLTAPVAGALLGKAATTLVATTTNDAAVSNLTFLDGTAPIATVAAAPFTTNWSPATAGAHSLTAQVTDRQGRVTTSAAVSITADIIAPTVVLTAPANGATVGGNVAVTAAAADDTTVARVEFYDGATLIATATSAPWAAVWITSAVPAGPHTLKARAYDTAGNATDSATVNVTVSSDVTPPSVSITAPANGAVVTGTVAWTASASDNVGVTRVELRDGATVVATLTSPPYTFSWDTTSAATGAHTLTARAYDAMGNATTSAAVGVTIDRTAPTVSLSAPASGATVSGAAVTVSATASDNAGLARVEFYRDNTTLLGTDSTSPYSISWDTTTIAAGSHTLKAIAYDVAGNATTSASRSVTVKDVTAPAVSITSPANGAQVTVGTTITMAATATDATGVSKVEFYVAGALLCTERILPYTCNWKVPSGTKKSYALVAKAYDAANNTRSSATVTVTSK
jgi:hypothetical protein